MSLPTAIRNMPKTEDLIKQSMEAKPEPKPEEMASIELSKFTGINNVAAPEPEKPAPKPETAKGSALNSGKRDEAFETLRGKYNAEVPRLHQEIKDLKETILRMSEKTPEVPSSMTPPEAVKWLTEEYGDKFVKNLRDMLIGDVRSEVEARVRPVEAKVSEAESRAASGAEDKYYDRLERAVPDWKAIDADPEFISWLEAKRVAGRSYHTLLQEAHRSFDAVGVSEIFSEWKSLKGDVDPREKQLTPKKRGSVPPPDDVAKPIITSKEITAMSDRYRRGKIDEKAWNKFLSEVATAQKEGRVR